MINPEIKNLITAKIYSYILSIFSGLGLVFLVVKRVEMGLSTITIPEIAIFVTLVFQLYAAAELSKFKKVGVIGGVIVASIWFAFAAYLASVSSRRSSTFWAPAPPMEPALLLPTLLLLVLSLYVLASYLGNKK